MRKILIIGKLNIMIKNVYSYLDGVEGFKVLVCPETKDVIENIMEIVEPDMVVLSLFGLSDANSELFDFFMNKFPDLKVLCCGTISEQETFKKYFAMPYYHVLTKPFSNMELQNKIDELLSESNQKKAPEEEKNTKIQKGVESKTEAEDLLESLQRMEDLEMKLRSGKKDKSETDGKKKILLVDDNAIQLRTLRSILVPDYEVLLASSGQDALKVMQKNKPDLIFLDYEMPEMNGKEVMERMMEIETVKDIPVVFFTGENDKKRIMDVVKLNPAGYLLKPPDVQKIHDTIEEILG